MSVQNNWPKNAVFLSLNSRQAVVPKVFQDHTLSPASRIQL